MRDFTLTSDYSSESMSSRAQKIAGVDWCFMRVYENIWRHITIFVPATYHDIRACHIINC